MRAIFTACTPEYAWHLPLWAWSAKRLWPDVQLVATIVGTRDSPVLIHDYLKALGVVVGIEDSGFPCLPAMSACLRFIYNYAPKADEVLITDADLVFLHEGLWRYMNHKRGILCYGAFTGAKKKPRRPEIAPNGWVGDMKRLCGGFVLVTPEWYGRTQTAREEWADRLRRGIWGTFRESDEVMLTRIITQSGLPLPDETQFIKVMRGLHVGDFRPNMAHRWGHPKRIRKWFPDESANAAQELLKDNGFLHALEIARDNPVVEAIWENVLNHLKGR